MDEPNDGTYVRAPTLEDLVRICKSLNQVQARYLLIGGFAVIAHGGGRTTKDIDFLVDPSAENIAKVKVALAVLEDNAAADVGDNDVAEYTVVRVADEVMVDLLGEACGITFAEAIQDSELAELSGVSIPVASKKTLIRTKLTVRPSDQMDRNFLESLIEAETP